MARTVRFASYLLAPGDLPVYDGFMNVAFHYVRGTWHPLSPVGVRIHPDEGNEFTGRSKYEVLSRLFDAVTDAPDASDLILAAVRSYHRVSGDSSSWTWILQCALVGLPDVVLGDGMDEHVIEIPSYVRLEPGTMEWLAKALLVDDVMSA